jgi:hypothetical protein
VLHFSASRLKIHNFATSIRSSIVGHLPRRLWFGN